MIATNANQPLNLEFLLKWDKHKKPIQDNAGF